MPLPFVSSTDLQPGSYLCVRTGSLFGFLVRLFTRSQFDHAFVYLGGGEIAEATVWGSRIDALASYSGALAVANSAEVMTAPERQDVCAKARSLAGEEYGWGTILVISLRLLGVRWGWLLRFADDRDAVICSELVAESGQAAGVDWLCGESEAALVTPAELAERRVMRSVKWA